MKKYKLFVDKKPGMSIEVIDAINEGVDENYIDEFIEEYFGFKFYDLIKPDERERQIELIELIKEQYFIEEEIDEVEDIWDYDKMEREREYRLMQGF